MAKLRGFGLASMFSMATLAALTGAPANAQYSSDPGVAYGQNICFITTEMGLPLTAAVGVAASPMLGFRGPSRAQAMRNGQVIMNYMIRVKQQNGGQFPDSASQKMAGTAMRYMVNNCKNGLSQDEYNWLMKDIRAGKI